MGWFRRRKPQGVDPARRSLSPWKRSVAAFALVMVTLNLGIAGLAGVLTWRSTARAQSGIELAQHRANAATAARQAVLEVDGGLMSVIARSDADGIRAAAVASIGAASRLDEHLQALQAVMPGSAQVQEMVKLADAIKPRRMGIIKLARQNDDVQALAALEQVAQPLTRIDELSRGIQTEEAEARAALLAGLRAEARELNVWLFSASGAGLLIGVLAYRRLMKRLSRSDELERLIGEVHQSAETLDQRGHELDELSHHITETGSSTARVMADVSTGLTETRTEAGRSLEALRNLSTECERSIAASREQAERASLACADARVSGDKLAGVARNTEALAESQKAIVEFTERISKISATTRLLSMNAAVEAARAGDSGRGFAVVAQSVRSLSEDTQQTVTEIRRLSQTVSEQMQQTVKAVSEAVQAVRSCGERIEGMERFAQDTAATVDAMAHGLQRFSSDLEQQTRRIDVLGSSVDGLESVLTEGRQRGNALTLTAEALARASANLRTRLASVA